LKNWKIVNWKRTSFEKRKNLNSILPMKTNWRIGMMRN
jgi:hypothetical protein